MLDRKDHELLKALRRLGQIEPDAQATARALARARACLAESQQTAGDSELAWRRAAGWRRWSLVPAAVAVAVLVVFWLWGDVGRPSVALADVVRTLRGLQSIRYTTSVDTGNGLSEESQTMTLSRNLVRTERFDGRVFVLDSTLGRSMVLFPDQRRAVLRFGVATTNDMFDVVDSLGKQRQVARILPEQEIDGVRAVGFVLNAQDAEHVVWVEPDSKLLVRWETISRNPASRIKRWVHSQFVYGQPVDAALFDLTPPPGYAVERQGVPELAPLAEPELQSPTLHVQEGIGPAKFGMPREEVIRVFGAPDEIDEALQSYRYPSRGLELMIDPKRGLWGVMCRAQPVAVSRGRTYSGRTDRGIGMGATADEIVAAYGPPDQRDGGATGETLSYKSLQLDFSLHEGRLVALQHSGFKKPGSR